MKPYYEEHGITIYHGDCREILPMLPKVDAVITDPPYGLDGLWKGGGGTAKNSWRFDPAEARTWDHSIVEDMPLLIAPFAEAIVWGGNYYPLPVSRCWLVWDKKQPDTWTTGQCELAWTNLERPVRAFRMAQCEQANEGFKSHPTQKPLALMKWCLKWIHGNSIVDPFMGSGTTLVAAKNLGRKAIGIEIEEKYCEIAAKRLSQSVLQFTTEEDDVCRDQAMGFDFSDRADGGDDGGGVDGRLLATAGDHYAGN